MIAVKEAARLVGVSPHTVRYYDKRGLLGEVSRDETGARVFDDNAIARLKTVALLRVSGMPLAEIERFARKGALNPPCGFEAAVRPSSLSAAAARKDMLEQGRARLVEKIAALEVALAEYDRIQEMRVDHGAFSQ